MMLVYKYNNIRAKHFIILKVTSNSKIVPENKFGLYKKQTSTLYMQVWQFVKNIFFK